MKKITNLIVIDASGSMSDKVSDVVGGLRELLTKIKEDASKDVASVSMKTIVTDFSSHNDFRTIVNSERSIDIDEKLLTSIKLEDQLLFMMQ